MELCRWPIVPRGSCFHAPVLQLDVMENECGNIKYEDLQEQCMKVYLESTGISTRTICRFLVPFRIQEVSNLRMIPREVSSKADLQADIANIYLLRMSFETFLQVTIDWDWIPCAFSFLCLWSTCRMNWNKVEIKLIWLAKVVLVSDCHVSVRH